MNYKRFLGTASGALMIIIAILMLAQGAGAASKYKTLYKFSRGKDGNFPLASLIFDQAGNLYGTTLAGGALNQGTVFKLTPNADGSWRESVLHRFCYRTNCGDGAVPVAGLVFDLAGNLYGATFAGGDQELCLASGCGVVFKLTPNSKGGWNERVLHAFADRPGASPTAGLIFDPAGNLYGTSSGSTTLGSVFEITP
jgi:uncharacterized repeat protein (TIGR03803 family)